MSSKDELENKILDSNSPDCMPFRLEYRWERDKDGELVPVAVSSRVVTKKGLKKLVASSLSLPYEGEYVDQNGKVQFDPDLAIEFKGMTKAEVMSIQMARKAAAGDISTANSILDRIVGKPTQKIESESKELTLVGFLDSLSMEDLKIDKDVINVSGSSSTKNTNT